jgi:hypothetical protein
MILGAEQPKVVIPAIQLLRMAESKFLYTMFHVHMGILQSQIISRAYIILSDHLALCTTTLYS